MSELSIDAYKIELEGISGATMSIKDVQIRHKMNDHGYAVVIVHMSNEDAKTFVNKVDSESEVIISATNAKDQVHKKLFHGYIEKVEAKEMQTDVHGTLLSVYLASFTKRLDIKKSSKTFQVESKKYEEILGEVIADAKTHFESGNIEITGANKSKTIKDMEKEIDKQKQGQSSNDIKSEDCWVIQYEQTPWEFVLQMASRMNACVFSDVTDKNGKISVGVPSPKASLVDETFNICNLAEAEISGYEVGKYVSYNTFLYGCVGDRLSLTVKKGDGNVAAEGYIVTEINASMQKGVLCTNITAMKEENIKQRMIYNDLLSGLILEGTVKEVEKNTVKVHFHKIDKTYDESTTKKFVFSTIYASRDSSGFFCMPEEEDKVRIMFQDRLERNAFVSGSVNETPLRDPKDKQWRAPGGQEILLCKEGICIVCEDENIFINLKTEGEIELYSKKDIKICSKQNVEISAKDKVVISSDREINVGVDQSSIKVTGAGIVMGAKGIYVN